MQKNIYVESIGSDVILAKRKGTRSMRLTLLSDGRIRLSVPYGITESVALKFLDSKKEWVMAHSKPIVKIPENAHIGKSHRLVIKFDDINKPKTRIKGNEVIVTLPRYSDSGSDEAQASIRKASERALMLQADKLLSQRLEYLSVKYGLDYSSLSLKKLKSRWGSCDSRKNIILNIYLMQLDWSLIDYVIAHELTHTVHQHHQKNFWDALVEIMPDCRDRRKNLKSYPTNIITTNF